MLTKIQNQILSLLSASVFGRECEEISDVDADELFLEAKAQSVFPLIYNKLPESIKKSEPYKSTYNKYLLKNISVNYEHFLTDRYMTEIGLPYTVFKGVAAASYYPEPILRTLGDVDFIIPSDDIEKATEFLKSVGYQFKSDNGVKHASFQHNGVEIEMHRMIHGVPDKGLGPVVRKHLKDLINTAVDYKTENGTVKIPDTFHHGLILLIHSSAHMTSEGVGLRHICDWAAFLESMSSDDFAQTFEIKLKECGLWKFAQIISALCVKYLNATPKEWIGVIDDEILDALINDIFTGGNFGRKDTNRYRHIKYLYDHEDHTVEKSSTVGRLWKSVKVKAERQHKSKARVIADYLLMLLKGKRKPDGISTINDAKTRRDLYSEFHLYE